MLTHRVRLRVFADYFQFYIWDPVASGQQAPEEWSDEDTQARAKTGDHLIVICPVRNMEVPFTLEIHDSEPEVLHSEWDHIVAASIALPSGKLEVDECTGSPLLQMTLPVGSYQLRALYKGLSTLSEDGLEGNDSYLLQMWPGSDMPLQVLKNYED